MTFVHSNQKSTRAIVRPSRARRGWQIGRGNPTRRTRARKRRSKSLFPPESTSSSSSNRTPERPEPRRRPRRLARNTGDVSPSRTALSIARSSSLTVALAARSTIVREADVHANGPTCARSIRSRHLVVWIGQAEPRPRPDRVRVNSTGPAAKPSKPWRAAAARCETSAPSPRPSSPAMSCCSHDGCEPAILNTLWPRRSYRPAFRRYRIWRALRPQDCAWAMEAHPYCRAAMVTSLRSESHLGRVCLRPRPNRKGHVRVSQIDNRCRFR